jgi:hypothetical protein
LIDTLALELFAPCESLVASIRADQRAQFHRRSFEIDAIAQHEKRHNVAAFCAAGEAVKTTRVQVDTERRISVGLVKWASDASPASGGATKFA